MTASGFLHILFFCGQAEKKKEEGPVHLFKSRPHRIPQWRLFWQSFWSSLILILFLCAFLYIACSQNSGIQEPILSVQLPYSQQKMTKRPTNRSDTLSLSFFGWKWELSIETMQQLSDQLSRWYRQYGVLIPARYRAAASAAVILWEELSKISREIFTTAFC